MKISDTNYYILCIKLEEQVSSRGRNHSSVSKNDHLKYDKYLSLFCHYSGHMYSAGNAGLFKHQEQ